MPDMTAVSRNINDIQMEGQPILSQTPPKLNDIPDILSEIDINRLKVGSQFYARFVMDPKGDSVRWAKDHIDKLKDGRMSRRNIGTQYWINGTYLERPPLAEYLGRGQFKILEP